MADIREQALKVAREWLAEWWSLDANQSEVFELADLLESYVSQQVLAELRKIHGQMYGHTLDGCGDYLEGTEPICERIAVLEQQQAKVAGAETEEG